MRAAIKNGMKIGRMSDHSDAEIGKFAAFISFPLSILIIQLVFFVSFATFSYKDSSNSQGKVRNSYKISETVTCL